MSTSYEAPLRLMPVETRRPLRGEMNASCKKCGKAYTDKCRGCHREHYNLEDNG